MWIPSLPKAKQHQCDAGGVNWLSDCGCWSKLAVCASVCILLGAFSCSVCCVVCATTCVCMCLCVHICIPLYTLYTCMWLHVWIRPY